MHIFLTYTYMLYYFIVCILPHVSTYNKPSSSIQIVYFYIRLLLGHILAQYSPKQFIRHNFPLSEWEKC